MYIEERPKSKKSARNKIGEKKILRKKSRTEQTPHRNTHKKKTITISTYSFWAIVKFIAYLLDWTGGVAYGTPKNASIGRKNL